METDLYFKSIPQLRMMAFLRGLNLEGVISRDDLVKLLVQPKKIGRQQSPPTSFSRKTIVPRTWKGDLLTTNYPGTPLPPLPRETIYPDLPPLSKPNLNLVCQTRSELASYFDRPGAEPFPCVPTVTDEDTQVEESVYPIVSSSRQRRLYQPPSLKLVNPVNTPYYDRLSEYVDSPIQ